MKFAFLQPCSKAGIKSHCYRRRVSPVLGILDRMNIPQEEVSILLINGFHHKPESEVKDGDIVALFPPVGGG